MKKIYYHLEMFQISPLRIGNGENDVTDNDLMCDSRGVPFIPGSSVAGVLRDKYEKLVGESTDELFGGVREKAISESHILVSDAVGPEGTTPDDYVITVRNGVGLDEWGVAIPEHKYDFQVVETKNPYYCVLEWNKEEVQKENEQKMEQGIELLLKNLIKNGIQFGARTTRGYGKMRVIVRRKQFDFPQDIEEWLDFDPLMKSAFQNEEQLSADETQENDQVVTIQAAIKIKGSFSVRVEAPDSAVLKNQDGKPVIPGTSWAGIFRHHMQEILSHIMAGDEEQDTEEKTLDLLFGKNEDGHIRSGIRFGETVIEGGVSYQQTRNAVERFTQAPRNTALFTAEFWQGGQGTLEIVIEKERMSRLQRQLLEVTLLDLDFGILTFGGGSGTGHGHAEITKMVVNGVNVTERLKQGTTGFLEEVV